jgi:transposase
MFDAAKKREADLKARIAHLEAENRILKQRLFGAKSESKHSPDRLAGPPACDPLAEDASPSADASSGSGRSTPPPRPRGQQQGQPIPDRRDYSHLPVITEEHVLTPEQSCCSCCGLPFAPAGFELDSCKAFVHYI